MRMILIVTKYVSSLLSTVESQELFKVSAARKYASGLPEMRKNILLIPFLLRMRQFSIFCRGTSWDLRGDAHFWTRGIICPTAYVSAGHSWCHQSPCVAFLPNWPHKRIKKRWGNSLGSHPSVCCFFFCNSSFVSQSPRAGMKLNEQHVILRYTGGESGNLEANDYWSRHLSIRKVADRNTLGRCLLGICP